VKVHELFLFTILSALTFGSTTGFSSAVLSENCKGMATLGERDLRLPLTDSDVDNIISPMLIGEYHWGATEQKVDLNQKFAIRLGELDEKNPLFESFGKSVTRLFAKTGNQLTPLAVLLEEELDSHVSKQELIEKLFRSGYQLVQGDIRKLMEYGESYPLQAALKLRSLKLKAVTRMNNEDLAEFFSRPTAVSPLFSKTGPQFYSDVVIEKLNHLYFYAHADLTSVLEGMRSRYWREASSKARVRIIAHLALTLGTPEAVNHSFEGGLTPLLLAIVTRDQDLASELLQIGANKDQFVSANISSQTLNDYNIRVGETYDALALRFGIQINNSRL
jgi:hypothetical protein